MQSIGSVALLDGQGHSGVKCHLCPSAICFGSKAGQRSNVLVSYI